eukprot:scaffold94240_cov69-Phaeocystis_antarctica.AAC.7
MKNERGAVRGSCGRHLRISSPFGIGIDIGSSIGRSIGSDIGARRLLAGHQHDVQPLLWAVLGVARPDL